MRVLVVGASGTIGRAVVKELRPRHEILTASRTGADFSLDLTEPEGIAAMFRQTGPLDAVVCCGGTVHFGPLAEMTPELYAVGVRDKLMGQVNLVLSGLPVMNDGGSFTLISGILAREPIPFGTSASMINGAIEAFVRSAAIEMPRGIRINAVSPTVLVESMEFYGPFFRGFKPVPASEVGLAYARGVEGAQTGRVYRV